MSVGAIGGSGGNAAIQYARQAPAALAPQAAAQAAEITVFKKAIDSQSQAALQLIAAIPDIGRLVNTYA
jgi:hypothetical protein